MRLLCLLAVLSAAADLLSLLLVLRGISSWPVINLFFIGQFILFFRVLAWDLGSTLLRVCFIGCLIFCAVDFLFLQKPQTLNSYTSYATGIVMIASAISFLYQLMAKLPVERVQTLPLFWVAFCVLVYYGGTMFLFLFNNYIMVHLPQSFTNYWTLHNLLNITKNGLLFVTLWINYKSRSQS